MADWMLFIYTLPSQPSRKRAYVWRELKRLGAVYLRDGVAVLPRLPQLEDRMQSMVERIQEYEGTVDLVLVPHFTPERERSLLNRFREERAAEYREVHHGCVRFLRDVLHEVDEDDFGFPDVDNLESELSRLRRWFQQIRERDYFKSAGADRVEEILEKCDRAFERFVSTAQEREGAPSRAFQDDVFEHLGGSPASEHAVQDLPL